MLSRSSRLLVSCIMPTCDRRPFVPHAIDYFLHQDYPFRELIIVDDGVDPVADLIPDDPRIRYVRLDARATVGAKRNLACEMARGGIIAHWDDDDWQARRRLRYQVAALVRDGALLCGIRTPLFYDLRTGQSWEYRYPGEQGRWLSGSTLCYARPLWLRNPFPDIDVGEDAHFVARCDPARVTHLTDATFHVGLIHDGNVSPKYPRSPWWETVAEARLRKLMGKDWERYRHASEWLPPEEERCPLPPERTVAMLTAARKDDLALPEYAAFNEGQALPSMRRWELPFACFQSRLENAGAVLDCTINPAGFGARLACLYPQVRYRHWNPIQSDRFVLPYGVPDAAFDRVFCINTLEHLLTPQREALIAALARKLKPGGLLILTSDYYFDAFWEDPAFLEGGVMRADRQEIFQGWNKITPEQWLTLCHANGLHPMEESLETPEEEDGTLLRNLPPYPHACIGGVFYKDVAPPNLPHRKIVLALLTWNTCEASLDSVRAYIREAHMLRRLGYAPFLCVCDNGSTDGTPEALRALEPSLDIPYRFLFNASNRGNSIARNQIIDVMLDCGADYLLFMDGDIEVVPFSSFAMLRFMENSGPELGCVGADSAGQTPSQEHASPAFFHIPETAVELTDLVAWTQYGLFRRAVFEAGIRFDEAAPFDQAGWGFEDNDLAFQMERSGYFNLRFFGMVYLHRAARSSVRIMLAQGVDAQALYLRRKQYVIAKWTGVPGIDAGPLEEIRRLSNVLC